MPSRIRSELGLAYSTGAFWRPGWEQQGLFWGTCGTKNQTAGLALREMLGVLDGFLAQGVAQEEFDQARSRLLNAQVFEVDEASKVLARIADLEWNGYPWSFHEQAAAALRELSAAEVVDACRRHLDTGRLTLFVLGNPVDFDVELGEFGAVEEWDSSAPEVRPVDASGDSEAAARGADLAAHLLSSHGGRAAWEGVGAAGSLLRTEGADPVEALLVYPGRFLARSAADPAQLYSVVTEEAGWSLGSAGMSELSAEQLRGAQLELKAKLPLVLMRLARSEYRAAAAAERTLLLTDEEGDAVTVELHEHGLCRAIVTEAGGRYEFGAYTLTGGVMLPGEVRWSDGGQPASYSFEWSVNPEVRAEWFEFPAGG
ncbi:MAG: insulinase family protein [Planctomycetes bacterium]|nr:insulinase family protein [Planctomycetota bacterium]